MASNARDSIENYSRMTSRNEFETLTRDVVMDFMGLVPITCPPSLISFRPFIEDGKEGSPYSDEMFHGDVTDGRKVKSFRISNLSDNAKHRTIIRKCNKLVILEEDELGEELVDSSKNQPPKSKSAHKLKLSKFFFNLVRFVKPSRLSSSHSNRDVHHLVSPASENKSFVKSLKTMMRKKPKDSNMSINGNNEECDVVDGPPKPVDLSIKQVPFTWNFPEKPPSPTSSKPSDISLKKGETFKTSRPVQKFQSILRKKSKKPDLKLKMKKESVYVDVGDVDDIDGMVVRKHLSPAALPLQRELQGLRTRPGTPVLSPQSVVANSLRAIADQVEVEYSAELSRAVGRLVNYEEAKRLGFEELKLVAMEMLKDMTPGWSQVAVPLLLSQMVAMTLLVLGNRSVVSRLVDFTTRFICDNLNSFVLDQGGWNNVRRMKVNELPIENSVLDDDDDDDDGDDDIGTQI